MGVFLWIVFGMIAGEGARHLLPGRAPAGTMVMYLLGIVGAIVGGSIGTQLGVGGVNDVEFWSLPVAIGGAVIVLAGHRLIARVLNV